MRRESSSQTGSIQARSANRSGAARAETFEGVAKEWLELQSKALSVRDHLDSWTRLKSFLYPYIGDRPVVERSPRKSCLGRCVA